MKIAEIRELSAEDLQARIGDTRKDIVDLRFQLACNKLEQPHKFRDAKRLLSQLLTVQAQKQNAQLEKVN